jgi:hypothetical protein
MAIRALLAYSLFCGCMAVAGCGGTSAPPMDGGAATPEVGPTTPVAASPAPANTEDSRTPDLADLSQTAKQVAEFTPPFPERLDLFEPPKRAQSTIRHDDDRGETVELKGFIDVDEPRVVLSIDGVISLVPEGGEKYGVQVRSIQPPNVVLQRGRDRWTATLE